MNFKNTALITYINYFLSTCNKEVVLISKKKKIVITAVAKQKQVPALIPPFSFSTPRTLIKTIKIKGTKTIYIYIYNIFFYYTLTKTTQFHVLSMC